MVALPGPAPLENNQETASEKPFGLVIVHNCSPSTHCQSTLNRLNETSFSVGVAVAVDVAVEVGVSVAVDVAVDVGVEVDVDDAVIVGVAVEVNVFSIINVGVDVGAPHLGSFGPSMIKSP
jgi:hypothetical protein